MGTPWDPLGGRLPHWRFSEAKNEKIRKIDQKIDSRGKNQRSIDLPHQKRELSYPKNLPGRFYSKYNICLSGEKEWTVSHINYKLIAIIL